jgi:uncharacterized membrane protein YebE (DUF533 family)
MSGLGSSGSSSGGEGFGAAILAIALAAIGGTALVGRFWTGSWTGAAKFVAVAGVGFVAYRKLQDAAPSLFQPSSDQVRAMQAAHAAAQAEHDQKMIEMYGSVAPNGVAYTIPMASVAPIPGVISQLSGWRF